MGVNNTVRTWHGRSTTNLDTLSITELNWVNKVLGKNYISAQIVEHDLFNNAGYSIIFTKSDSSYSEAVAGSGEVSVVNCVKKTLRAENDSLILLDEPEVSLHPGAQTALRELLFHVIVTKGCQVIMSTHSEHFVQGLPNNAIKLFQHEEPTCTYNIINSCSPEQAFLRLGSELHNTRRKIYVEDVLAKELVIEAVKEIDPEVINNIDVIAYPGGADTIIKNLLVHFTVSTSPDRDMIFLDGDMRKCIRSDERLSGSDTYVEQRGSYNIPTAEHCNIDQIILEQTGMRGDSFTLPLNGGNASNDNQALQFKLNMLDVYHEKFKFMPIDTPEELIWEIASGDELYNIQAIKNRFPEGDFKRRFRALSKFEYGENTNSTQIFELQKRFLAQRNKDADLWQNFKESVRLLLQAEDFSSTSI